MEYYYIFFIQILIILLSIVLRNNGYLVSSKDCYKKYSIVGLIIQGLCFIANVVIMIAIKEIEIMTYVLVLQIILMGIIDIFYSVKAKKLYFQKLTNFIVNDNLLSFSAKEIKYYLLVNYGEIYFVEEIEKCIDSITNK